MTGLARPIGRVSLLALTLVAFGLASRVDAQPSFTRPVVTLDRTDVAIGAEVALTIDGFTSPSVTIAVCGNEARRGSADCNMVASLGELLAVDGSPTVITMRAAAPPVPCPCLVRVSSRFNDEIAVAPISLIGHPVAPVVDSPGLDDPLVVSISAQSAPRGVVEPVRFSLGGPGTYDVTVTVKNRSTVRLSHVTVAGSVGRNAGSDLATLELDDPGELDPGESWQQVVSAEVPAPTFGKFVWRVAVSGAGPTITATDTTQHRPLLLLLLAMLLVLDVSLLAIRFAMRRRAAHDAARGHDVLDEDALAVAGPGIVHDAM